MQRFPPLPSDLPFIKSAIKSTIYPGRLIREVERARHAARPPCPPRAPPRVAPRTCDPPPGPLHGKLRPAAAKLLSHRRLYVAAASRTTKRASEKVSKAPPLAPHPPPSPRPQVTADNTPRMFDKVGSPRPAHACARRGVVHTSPCPARGGRGLAAGLAPLRLQWSRAFLYIL